MEPVCNQNIYYFIGLLKDLPNFKFHRGLFIEIFEDLSSELARIACTPKLLESYKILHQEYLDVVNGHCPFEKKSTVKKIQELLFHGVVFHSKFNDLPLNEVVSFLKSGNIPTFLLEQFKNHPTIKNISEYKYEQIFNNAANNEESTFLKLWFQCRPTEERYLPSDPQEREHVQILREMRRDAPDLPLDKRKKGALYLAIREGFPASARGHLASMTLLSLEDVVFYLCRAIKTGNLEMIHVILDKAIDKSEYEQIKNVFSSMKIEGISQKKYEKLILNVFENEDLDVLSILLAYESIAFEDNVAEQLLADLIDDCIDEQDYETIRSFYVFDLFNVEDLIKSAAKSYLFKWVCKGQRKRVIKFLKTFPECFDLVLKIAAKEGTPEDHREFIKVHSHLAINTTSLLKAASIEDKFENVKFLIEEYGMDVNHQSEDGYLTLLTNVIRDGSVEMLNLLENSFEIDLKSFLIREVNDKWTIDTLLEIIFNECKNSISMMDYFSAVLRTAFLTKPTLIESYINNASSDQFHEKVYLISLTCADGDEQHSFREIAKMHYDLVNPKIWGKLAGNLYLSDSDQVKMCEILKECTIDDGFTRI